MKLRIFYFVMLMFASCSFMNAQEKGGCDLCGPSGTSMNHANGNYSVTIGVNNYANGLCSMAFGNSARTAGGYSMALGCFVRTNATNAVIIGSGLGDTDAKALINNRQNSLMIGFNSKKPTLFVGTSNGGETTGKIGIGNVTNPSAKLHLKSDSDEDAGLILETSNAELKSAFIQLYDINNRISASKDGMNVKAGGNGLSLNAESIAMICDDMSFDVGSIDMKGSDLSFDVGLINMKGSDLSFDAGTIKMNGRVGINVNNNFTGNYNYSLAVNGGILTSEVYVKEVSEWHDDVFKDDYELMPLNAVESYINANGCLPGVPSESEVLDNGFNLAKMDGILLKKIEELTLYIMDLQEQLQKQQKTISSIESRSR